MLLLCDGADHAEPWICSFTTLPTGQPGWVHPRWDPVALLWAAQESLDQAEVFSFHDILLIVHQGWNLSTAVPKPENSSPAGGGLLCCPPQFDKELLCEVGRTWCTSCLCCPC